MIFIFQGSILIEELVGIGNNFIFMYWVVVFVFFGVVGFGYYICVVKCIV